MDCVFEYILLKNPDSSMEENDDMMLDYLQQRFMNTFLKVQAITQLGYSRGGSNACLPDDIINYIKQFVFYDFLDQSIQEKKALSILKEHEHNINRYWKSSLRECRCGICYKTCLWSMKLLIRDNIVRYVKMK